MIRIRIEHDQWQLCVSLLLGFLCICFLVGAWVINNILQRIEALEKDRDKSSGE